ncbi:MAG: CRTAC1 family protein [Gemmataceae bacterium]|nr:CRTAC1 family protein [Gemmataceae bacterium]
MLGLLALGLFLYLPPRPEVREPEPLVYKRRMFVDTSGFLAVYDPRQPSWSQATSLNEVATLHRQHVVGWLEALDELQQTRLQPIENVLLRKATLLHSQGKAVEAYQALKTLEAEIKGTPLEEELLGTIIYYLGVTGLRIGENDNCVLCRGESSCILPIAPAAVHQNPTGSRLAVKHFSDYLRIFPDDFEVQWLLNLAHMTLGEHPDRVEPRHRLLLDPFCKPSEFDIGKFRDVSHRVGIQDRLNQSGGAIMEDFDDDGLLDFVVTGWSPGEPLAFYRNKGDGTFEDRTKAAGLDEQLGGLYCVQTDYDNDGHMDIFVPRGAWMPAHMPIRPSLLRNSGKGTFSDVTRDAGLATPLNSNSASWADYDNDGFLDVFMCGQHRPCALYRNKGDGAFEEAARRAGLPADLSNVLGAAWIDVDNDGYPELFANIGIPPGLGAPQGTARLYRNNRDGTFTDVTSRMGIDGPTSGFSCWAWDYDNDGWLDIFATSTVHSLEDIVKGMLDQPHELPTPKLFRNLGGKGFRDVTKEAGPDKVCAPMGSNYGDVDNDGYLDIYLGTGNPCLGTLVPNRLFRNVAAGPASGRGASGQGGARRFAEITGSSGTGHLQKGHGVAFGDWRRCGSVDIFIQVGGAVPGDRYHNVLFQNPGQGNNWLSVKLVGKKTNRAAIGARIKVVTAPAPSGEAPLTVHRHVSSGSSFGANPLEQHIGLGKADRVARLEIHWPTSGTTQVFEDIAANQGIVVTEFAKDYQTRSWKPIAAPE